MAAKPLPLNFLPGVQRDGTRLDSDSCVDAQWTRFRLARPRKMGGYKESTDRLGGVGRRMHIYYKGSQAIVHVGTSKGIEQIVLDPQGNFVSRTVRTPANFIGGISPGWTLDAVFDTTSEVVQLIAHSVPNVDIVADTVRTPPFKGIIDATDILTEFGNPSTTNGGQYPNGGPRMAGGIVCVQPYVFSFDVDGSIGWSSPNMPETLGVYGGFSGAGRARVSAQKVVAGMPLRGGGGNSPAAIFWSLSEVIQASFVGQTSGIFAFNTVSPNSSILSGATVIEYDGLYFWAGVDRFLVYNGTVVEVPNKYNQDWFFDNINWDYAGKSFAFKVPRFGEIWFCAPLFGATEPSHAVIYNVREQCWYDTVLPDGGRSAAYFAQGFRYPMMSGVREGEDGFSLWLHEFGKNRISLAAGATPVRSYYETPFLGGPRSDPPDTQGLTFQQLEPDFRQVGDMAVWVAGGFNARARDSRSQASIIKAIPTVAEQLIGFKASYRLARLHFESYAMNGDFIAGKSVLHVDRGDGLMTGGVGKPLTAPPERTAEDTDAPLTDASTPLSEFAE